jgi:uncharacterized protein (TIGR02271 family)
VESVWAEDATDEPKFLGVKTGWLFGRTHVIPGENANVDEHEQAIRIPWNQEKVKEAPSMEANKDLTPEEEARVREYYWGGGSVEGHRGEAEGLESEDLTLHEERLRVGKREVPQERLTLRKIVRSEHVSEPVDLKREELHVEREPVTGEAGETREAPGEAFEEQEMNLEATREEPIVDKETTATERVHAYKTTETERQNVEGEVRKEDVETERDEETRRGRHDREHL